MIILGLVLGDRDGPLLAGDIVLGIRLDLEVLLGYLAILVNSKAHLMLEELDPPIPNGDDFVLLHELTVTFLEEAVDIACLIGQSDLDRPELAVSSDVVVGVHNLGADIDVVAIGAIDELLDLFKLRFWEFFFHSKLILNFSKPI